MFELNVLIIAWCATALVLTGIVKGILGIGLPLVAVPLLALVMPVPQAVALMPVPILVSNFWQASYGGHFLVTLRRFRVLIVAMIIGTFIGAKILTLADPRALYAVIGSIVVVFSLTGFLRPDFHVSPNLERWLSPGVGLVSGILGGVSTIYGPPLVIFLAALRLPKDEFVGTIATLYLCGIIPITFAFGTVGVMGAQEFLWSALAAVPLMLGVPLGQVLRRRLKQEIFHKGLLVTLIITGLSLIGRAG